jgi:hypothetical protein
MRYFALVLFTGTALSSIPAAAAVSGDTPRDAIVVAYTCPIYEGYPDCHPDGEPAWTLYPGRPSAPARDAHQRSSGAMHVAHDVRPSRAGTSRSQLLK